MALLSQLLISLDPHHRLNPQAYAAATYQRLRKLGISDRNAMNQISYCLAEILEHAESRKFKLDDDFYRQELDKLPILEDAFFHDDEHHSLMA